MPIFGCLLKKGCQPLSIDSCSASLTPETVSLSSSQRSTSTNSPTLRPGRASPHCSARGESWRVSQRRHLPTRSPKAKRSGSFLVSSYSKSSYRVQKNKYTDCVGRGVTSSVRRVHKTPGSDEIDNLATSSTSTVESCQKRKLVVGDCSSSCSWDNLVALDFCWPQGPSKPSSRGDIERDILCNQRKNSFLQKLLGSVADQDHDLREAEHLRNVKSGSRQDFLSTENLSPSTAVGLGSLRLTGGQIQHICGSDATIKIYNHRYILYSSDPSIVN